MKAWGKQEITPRQREAMERAGRKALRWLSNGSATDDSLKGAMDCTDRVYELTIAALERDGYIERGTWGALSVWRKKI